MSWNGLYSLQLRCDNPIHSGDGLYPAGPKGIYVGYDRVECILQAVKDGWDMGKENKCFCPAHSGKSILPSAHRLP